MLLVCQREGKGVHVNHASLLTGTHKSSYNLYYCKWCTCTVHAFIYIYIYQPTSFCAYRSALCVCVSDSFAGPVSAKGQCTVPAYPSAV